jgi:hypothetical protein
VLAVGLGGGALALPLWGMWSARHVLAVLPAVILVLIVHALRAHPRRLKRVGWALVAGNVATLVLLVS